MPRPRDTQRSKVYGLKPRQQALAGKLTLAECETLIKDAHARYGLLWRGRITNGGGTRTATGSPDRINLPLWARTRETVLHEAAHAITDSLWPWGSTAAHGPEYARVLLELWAWAKLDTMPALREQARTKKVKVSQNPKCVPPKVTAVRSLERAKERYAKAKAELEEARRELDEARRALRG